MAFFLIIKKMVFLNLGIVNVYLVITLNYHRQSFILFHIDIIRSLHFSVEIPIGFLMIIIFSSFATFSVTVFFVSQDVT